MKHKLTTNFTGKVKSSTLLKKSKPYTKVGVFM